MERHRHREDHRRRCGQHHARARSSDGRRGDQVCHFPHSREGVCRPRLRIRTPVHVVHCFARTGATAGPHPGCRRRSAETAARTVPLPHTHRPALFAAQDDEADPRGMCAARRGARAPKSRDELGGARSQQQRSQCGDAAVLSHRLHGDQRVVGEAGLCRELRPRASGPLAQQERRRLHRQREGHRPQHAEHHQAELELHRANRGQRQLAQVPHEPARLHVRLICGEQRDPQHPPVVPRDVQGVDVAAGVEPLQLRHQVGQALCGAAGTARAQRARLVVQQARRREVCEVHAEGFHAESTERLRHLAQALASQKNPRREPIAPDQAHGTRDGPHAEVLRLAEHHDAGRLPSRDARHRREQVAERDGRGAHAPAPQVAQPLCRGIPQVGEQRPPGAQDGRHLEALPACLCAEPRVCRGAARSSRREHDARGARPLGERRPADRCRLRTRDQVHESADAPAVGDEHVRRARGCRAAFRRARTVRADKPLAEQLQALSEGRRGALRTVAERQDAGSPLRPRRSARPDARNRILQGVQERSETAEDRRHWSGWHQRCVQDQQENRQVGNRKWI